MKKVKREGKREGEREKEILGQILRFSIVFVHFASLGTGPEQHCSTNKQESQSDGRERKVIGPF